MYPAGVPPAHVCGSWGARVTSRVITWGQGSWHLWEGDTSVVLSWGDFAPPDTFGNVQRRFWLSQWGGGVLLASYWVQTKDAAGCPQCTGQPPQEAIFPPQCQQCRGWETLDHVNGAGSQVNHCHRGDGVPLPAQVLGLR